MRIKLHVIESESDTPLNFKLQQKIHSQRHGQIVVDTSGLTLKQDVSGILCMHGRDDENGFYAIDLPEQSHHLSNEKIQLDEIIASSTSYVEHGQLCQNEFEEATLNTNCDLAIGNSTNPTRGMNVDMIAEDEERWSVMTASQSSISSDSTEEEGCLDSDEFKSCYTADMYELNDELTVTVFPEYVIHGGTLYGESQLVFSIDNVKIECSDASGSDEKFASEWAVTEIDHIDCQWSESVASALVKLCFRENIATKIDKVHNNTDVLKVIFSVNDVHWLEKEQKIRNLTAKYKVTWNFDSRDKIWEDVSVGSNALFSRDKFTEIEDSFEDVVYPKGDPDAVCINKRDIDLLQPETFINDTIIDFYIKYLKDKIQSDQKHRFHFFNSFFFRKLADLDKDRGSISEGRAAFLRVRKWTRKVNIFEKDYIFIPVNFNLHWSLLIICHPGEVGNLKGDEVNSCKVPCILHMDSIKGSHNGLKNIIQSYMWEEWKERHTEASDDDSSKFLNLRFVSLEVPQQENSFDCGLFLLHYVELFLQEAPSNFDPFQVTKFSSFLSADWFLPSEASLKRSHIRKLIRDLLRESSHKVIPSTSCNGNASTSVYPGNNLEQKHGQLLSVSPDEDAIDTASSPDRGDGIKLLRSAIVPCDKEAGFLFPEFLESAPESNMPLPDPGVHVHEHSTSSKLFASCPTMEHANGSEQLSLNVGKDDWWPLHRNLNTQLSSTSPKAVRTSIAPCILVDVKDDISSTLESPNADGGNTNISSEAENKKASPDDFGRVPETLTSMSREMLDGIVADSQEDKCLEDSQRITRADCQIVDGQESVSDPCEVVCELPKVTTVDVDEECLELATTEVVVEEGEFPKETSSKSPRHDDNCREMCMDCHENVSSSQGVIITDDDEVTGKRSAQTSHKRRKVMILPEGTRMRTRSFSRENDTRP
ncbi:probable ubiquitin-like-specific protease 2B isoform X2 [Zingiber officinale]|uniref:probable ubiquitin-like-specific protease 2B isoform X2 n=1 Tax=Zingiber officinale TaxID=94328 RepID=UPI001C4D94D1|nr:probable ubiquitin-like-specific protease 2B isoform X2 [Zingiber officinale]